MKNSEKPAYPQQGKNLSKSWEYDGLTKRERFAMAAMQGLCANSEEVDAEFKFLASNAVYAADALLEELEKQND